jgi:ABC-type transport system involved in multi-copper enzyme maturation permease subunit
VIDISEVYCIVALIILPLLATAIARRDEEWKTASMMASYPYRTWEMEAARLLCAATIPLVAALVPMGAYAWLVVNDGISWGMREWYTCAVLASFAIPMLFATVIAYLVGILIRKRYSYLISFVLLLSLAIILPEFFKTERPSFSLPPHTTARAFCRVEDAHSANVRRQQATAYDCSGDAC